MAEVGPFGGPWLAPWQRACARLADAGYGADVPEAFRRAGPAIAAAVGPEPAIDLAAHVSAVAIKAGPPAAALFAGAAVAAAQRIGDGPRFRRWASLVQRLAATAPESVVPVLARTDALLAGLDVSALDSWILAGLRAGGADPERRRAFFAGETPESGRLLAREMAETGFGDVERRMRAWFTALWGIRLPIREALPGRPDGARRRVGFAPGIVTVPATFPGFRGPRAEDLFRAALAHVGAHMTFGGPRFPVGKLKPLQIAAVSLIEDARVEHLAMRQLPGLARLWLPFHVAPASGALTAPGLLARLARALIDPEFEDIDGWVRKGRDLFFAARDRWDDPGISRAIGNLLGNDLGQMRVQFNPRTHVVEPPYRDDNTGLWDYGDDAPAETLETELLVDAIRLVQAEAEGGRTEADRDAGRAAPARDAAPQEALPVARLPEWDWQACRLRPDWVTVLEAAPARGRPRFVTEALDRHAGTAARIDALVRAARVGRAERLRRRAEGETLDLDAAIGAVADLRGGLAPDPRVYQASARRRRDLTVSLILDASQSTADRAPEGPGTVLDLECDAAALFGHAMAALGDPFEMFAFDSDGREAVRVYPVKRYGEPFGPAAAAALAGLAPGRSTRLGAALRHAGAGLARQRTHRRLVLLVTDGEPSDVDCPDPRYLAEDARHAVMELRRAGIDVFCLALGPRNADALTRIFGPRGFVVLPRIAALPERLPALYFRLAR